MTKTAIPLNDGTVYLMPVTTYTARAIPVCDYLSRKPEIDDKLIATIEIYTALKEVGYFESTIPPMFVLALLDIILSIGTPMEKVTEILKKQYRPYMELLKLIPPSKP